MELQIRYFCTPEPIYSMICALHGTYEHKRISYLHSAAWGRHRSSVRLELMEPRSQAAAVVRRREKGTRARDGGGGAVESWGGRYPRKIAGGASLAGAGAARTGRRRRRPFFPWEGEPSRSGREQKTENDSLS